MPTEDEDVSAAAATAFRQSGITVQESFGSIESFEETPAGVRMTYSRNGQRFTAEAAIAVVAVGWVADTAGLNLARAGVDLNQRKFVKVDGRDKDAVMIPCLDKPSSADPGLDDGRQHARSTLGESGRIEEGHEGSLDLFAGFPQQTARETLCC
jgi:hypothetical protein